MGMNDIKKAIEQLDWYFQADDGCAAEDITKAAYQTLKEALKAQKPKVMTLDLPPAEWEDKVIWLEIRGKEPTPCLFNKCRNGMMFGHSEQLMCFHVIGSAFEREYVIRNYGVKWRCWTTKPTREQREAEPWQE